MKQKLSIRRRNASPSARAVDSPSDSLPVRPRHVLAIFALLSLLSIAWAFATPLMGVPDEPSHTIRAAAVAGGQPLGDTRQGATFTYPLVMVPEYIVEATRLGCFAGNAAQTADCQVPVSEDDDPVVASSSASSNSPIYYAVVGLPTLLLDGTPALYAMRVVSALLTSLLLTIMFVALHKQSTTWWPVAAGIVGITPMALFLSGAINPNAAEMAGAGAVLATVSLMLRRSLSTTQLWGYGALAVMSSFILTGGRTIGLLWLAVIAVVLLISTPWHRVLSLLRKPPVIATAAGIAAAALAVILWFRFSVTPIDPTGMTEGRAPGIPTVILITLEATFDNWTAWIGQFGWLDYTAPSGVQAIWHAAILGILVAAVVYGRGRARVALVVLATISVLVPPLVQASLFDEVGWLWQGRYGIALYLSTLLLAGITLDDGVPNSRSWVARRAIRTGSILLAAAHIVTFVFVLRRYVVGSQSWPLMLRDPSWQPPLGWIPLFLIFSALWVCALILIFRWTSDSFNPTTGRRSTLSVPSADAAGVGATEPAQAPVGQHMAEVKSSSTNPAAQADSL